MQMLIIALVLQATTPNAADPAQATAQTAAASSTTPSECHYDRVRRAQVCVNAAGEELRCRRERVLGSRLPVRLCTTLAEDQAMEDESRRAIDGYQHVTTPGAN